MKIAVSSKGKYDAVKAILLAAMTMFIGPAVMSAVMTAVTEGDTTRYLMAVGLLLIGVVFIIIYVLLCIEEGGRVTRIARKYKKDEPEEDRPVDEEE